MLARSREEQRDIQIIERDLTSDLANQFNQRIDLEGMFLPCLTPTESVLPRDNKVDICGSRSLDVGI